jgi:hypothetical protein
MATPRQRWNAETAAEAAEFFDVHPSTVRGWLSEGCPGSRGAYDLSAMTIWLDGRKLCSLHRATGGLIAGQDLEELLSAREERAGLPMAAGSAAPPRPRRKAGAAATTTEQKGI